jgi:hypothetical protein
LTSRSLLQRKLLDLECDLRGTLRNFGLKVEIVALARKLLIAFWKYVTAGVVLEGAETTAA